MPTRPAIHQPHFAKTPEQLDRQKRERQHARDADRPSSTERGYDGEWRKLRASFVADNPVCCVPDCNRPTVDADHVEDVRHHPERRLDPTNLRPYCHEHHAQRTAREQGFARGKDAEGQPKVSTRGALYPDWLRASRVPLRLICGPPASGKTTFVDQHVGTGDAVLDLDVIKATLSGLPIYQPGIAYLDEALRYRNAQLGQLHSPYCRLGGCWLIVSAPKVEQRMWWCSKLRPLAVIILATPADQCHARIDADPRCGLIRDHHHREVDRWWHDYSPGAVERVLRASGDGAGEAR